MIRLFLLSERQMARISCAKDWVRVKAPTGLNSPRYRGILVQGQMCTRAVVIVHVQKEHLAQVPLAEGDDMVKAFPPERANQPFRMPILLG